LRSLGFRTHTNGVMRILTDQLNAHIKKQAENYGVEKLWWNKVDGGKNGAKSDYVKKHFVGDEPVKGNKVYCILEAMESTYSFANRELLTKKGKVYNKIFKCKKRVKHYYVYFHDELLGGLCYLKICSYLPFPCEFYFNGHQYIAQELDKKGIGYKMKDNAFVKVDDLDVLKELSSSLKGQEVLERIKYWQARFFKFEEKSYSTCSKYLEHNWYSLQVEICSNTIFKSALLCTNLFERLIDKFIRFGSPESLIQVFDKKRLPKKTKSSWRKFTNNGCLKHWFGKNSIKMYNKIGYFIRFETTINDPNSLGLQKPIGFLQSYYWKGLACNNRFMGCCSDVDVSSLMKEEVEQLTEPVVVKNGKKVAAMDLRKKRQIELFGVLLNPKYSIHGFRTRELLVELPGQFRNSAQIRYEMAKLRARGLIMKEKNQCFYRVTSQGWKWLWVSICSSKYFNNPLVSMDFSDDEKSECAQASKFEESCQLLNSALSTITKEFAMA